MPARICLLGLFVALCSVSSGWSDDAKKPTLDAVRKAAKLQAVEIQKAVETYMIDHNNVPPPNLKALLVKDGDGNGPYLRNAKDLLDPWDNPYRYDPAGPHHQGLTPDIWSGGPNGKEKIGNWGTPEASTALEQIKRLLPKLTAKEKAELRRVLEK